MTLPFEISDAIVKYIFPVFAAKSVDEDFKNLIADAMTAAYTYGEIAGLCKASAATGATFLSALIPNDDDPVSCEIINECKPKEAILIEKFRKEMV